MYRGFGKAFPARRCCELEFFPLCITFTGISKKNPRPCLEFSPRAKPGSLYPSPSGLKLCLSLLEDPKISQCLASGHGKHWLIPTLPSLFILSAGPDVTVLIFLGLMMGKKLGMLTLADKSSCSDTISQCFPSEPSAAELHLQECPWQTCTECRDWC